MNRHFKTFAVVTFCVVLGFTYGNHMTNRTTNQGPATPIRETNPRQIGSALPTRGANPRLIGFILPRADGTSTLQLMPGARQLIGPGRRIGTAPLSHLRNLAAMAARNSDANIPSGSPPVSINTLNAARRPSMLRQESPASSGEPGRTQNNRFIQPPQRTGTSSSTAQHLQNFVLNRTNLSSSGIVARSSRPSGEIINMLQNTGLAGIRRRQPTVPTPRRATTLVNGMSLSRGVNNSGIRGSVGVSRNIGTLDSVARERVVASNTTETGKGNMGSVVRTKVTDIQSSVNVAQPGVSTRAVQNISGVVDSDTIRKANNRGPKFDIMQGGLDNVDIGPKQVLGNQSRTQTVDNMFKSTVSNHKLGFEAIRLPDGPQTAANVSGNSNMNNVKSIFMNVSDMLKTPHVDVRLDATSTLHGIAKATDQFANMIPVKADERQFDGLDNTKNKSSNVSFDGGLNVERVVPVAHRWIPAERGMASEATGAESSKVNVPTFSSIQPSKVPVINIGVSQDIAGAEIQTGMNASFNNISGQSMNLESVGSRDVAQSEFVSPGAVVSRTFLSTNNSAVTGESGQPVISTNLYPVLASILGREKSVLADHEKRRANVTENAVLQDSASAIRKRLRTEVQNVLEGVISNGDTARAMSSSTVGDRTSSFRKPSALIHNQEVKASNGLIGLKLLEQNVHNAIQNITSGARENPDLVYTDKKTLRTVIEDALREMLSIFMNKSSTGATPSGRDTTDQFNTAGVPVMKIVKEKVKKAETDFPTNTANVVYSKTGIDASLPEAEVNVSGNAASRTNSFDLKGSTGFDKLDSKGSTTFVKETTGEQALNHAKVVDMTTLKSLVELESKHFSSNVNSSASTEESQLVSDISKSSFATENVKPIVIAAVQRPLVSSRGVKRIIGDWDGTLKEVPPPLIMFNDVNNGEIHKPSHHQLFVMDNQVQLFTPLTPSLPFLFSSTPAAVMNRRNEDRQQSPPPIPTPVAIVFKSPNSSSGEAASSVLSSSFRIQIGNTEANDTNTASDHSNIPRTEKIIVELSSISRDMENKTASSWLDTKYNHTIEGMVTPLYNSRSFSPGNSTTPNTSSRGENARSADGHFNSPGSSAPNVISYSTQNKSITYVPSLVMPGPNAFSGQHAIAQNDKSQTILHLFTIPTNQGSSNASGNPIRDLTANNVSSNISISASGEYNLNIPNDNNSVITVNQSIASLNESIVMYHSISTQRENSSLQLKNDNSTALSNIETIDNTTIDTVALDSINATAQSNSTDIFDFSSSTVAMTTPEATTVSTIPTPTTPDPDAFAEIRELQRVANMFISPNDPNASELKAEAAEAREALL